MQEYIGGKQESVAMNYGVKICYVWGKQGVAEAIKYEKQAGAELCQAQEKPGLAMHALPSKKLWSSSI